ncbi:MAG TPA: helix-turn-helix transcriptional regulator [Polyangiaceae bacterium]|jgi:DNA-binding CsgD family transcriptional regulator
MLHVDHAALVDFVEDLYRDGLDDTQWCGSLLRGMTRWAGARSAALFQLRAGYHRGRFVIRDIGNMTLVGTDGAWSDRTLETVVRAPNADVQFGRTHAGTASVDTGLGAALPHAPGWRECWKVPVADSIGLISADPNGLRHVACVAVDRVLSLDTRTRRLLTRVAAHLGAGGRLRADRRGPDGADAILSPEGRLLHTAVQRCGSTDSVVDGFRRRDFARQSRHDAEKALEVWQGLVDGRWSIVDHVDTDGKRFVLAMKNAPEVDPREGLPPEERRVAALAAMGHRDKEIAYMLGITPAAVAASLRRVRAALRVKTRAELAAAWRRGTGPGL